MKHNVISREQRLRKVDGAQTLRCLSELTSLSWSGERVGLQVISSWDLRPGGEYSLGFTEGKEQQGERGDKDEDYFYAPAPKPVSTLPEINALYERKRALTSNFNDVTM